jgi:hypothetical protein
MILAPLGGTTSFQVLFPIRDCSSSIMASLYCLLCSGLLIASLYVRGILIPKTSIAERAKSTSLAKSSSRLSSNYLKAIWAIIALKILYIRSSSLSNSKSNLFLLTSCIGRKIVFSVVLDKGDILDDSGLLSSLLSISYIIFLVAV